MKKKKVLDAEGPENPNDMVKNSDRMHRKLKMKMKSKLMKVMMK